MPAPPAPPHDCKRELRRLSRDLQKAEERVKLLRHERDAAFWKWKKEGLQTGTLALAAGTSTKTVHAALYRYQTNEIAGRAHF